METLPSTAMGIAVPAAVRKTGGICMVPLITGFKDRLMDR